MLELNIHTISEKSFWVDHVQIIPIEVMHKSLPIPDPRIGNMVYITDANHISLHISVINWIFYREIEVILPKNLSPLYNGPEI
jgi:hypothetical protein